MKMMPRSPDERLRRRLTVLEPVGIEFQTPVETVYPGGGAYLTSGFGFIFVLKYNAKEDRTPVFLS
jgi:hypothetical protein